jgi:hypothetical protein
MAANRNYLQLVIKNAPTSKIPFTALRKIPAWQWFCVFHIREVRNIYTYVANLQTHTDTICSISAASATVIRVSYKNKNINCYRFNIKELNILPTL